MKELIKIILVNLFVLVIMFGGLWLMCFLLNFMCNHLWAGILGGLVAIGTIVKSLKEFEKI